MQKKATPKFSHRRKSVHKQTDCEQNLIRRAQELISISSVPVGSIARLLCNLFSRTRCVTVDSAVGESVKISTTPTALNFGPESLCHESIYLTVSCVGNHKFAAQPRSSRAIPVAERLGLVRSSGRVLGVCELD